MMSPTHVEAPYWNAGGGIPVVCSGVHAPLEESNTWTCDRSREVAEPPHRKKLELMAVENVAYLGLGSTEQSIELLL